MSDVAVVAVQGQDKTASSQEVPLTRRQEARVAKQAAKAARPRRLPAGMPRRLWTMSWFTLALGFTGFGNINELAYMPFFAWIGVLVAITMYVFWGDRTRPKVNGFWILLGILWFALVILQIRPYLGFVAALPVALLWIHDAPAAPSAMMTWGLLATLFQDFDVWAVADSDTAFYVVLAMVLFLGAAQAERERLARRAYAPTGKMWMTVRLVAVLLWSLVLVAGREALQAISFFTYLGLDLRGTSGKVTMLLLILAGVAVAAMLFRVRPYKYVDPYEQPRDEKGRRVARASAVAQVDFDEDTKRVKAKKVAKASSAKRSVDFEERGAGPPARAKPVAKTAPKPRGPLQPGEIDFD